MRGALLYNLGLIEERSGNPDGARKRYEESLAVRPGNAIVKKALATLPPKTAEAAGAPPAQGESTLLKPASVSASSAIRQKEDHPPEHAFDGDPKTAWNEAAPGPGRGEWIQATLDGVHRIRRIKMATGYTEISPKYGDLFAANSHLKKLSVLVDGKVVKVVDVGADQRWLTLDLDEKGQTVRFVADEVYAGAKWQDLCISEIEIHGGAPAP